MKMPHHLAQWLERNLQVMATDDISAMFFVDDYVSDKKQWQYGVDIIYRCLVCDLIKGLYIPETPLEFVQELASVDPFDDSPENDEPLGVWFGPLLNCTYRGKMLVAKYGLLNSIVAEALAYSWQRAAEKEPNDFPVNGLDSAEAALLHAKRLRECAEISRAAGWQPSEEWEPVNEAMIEEIEARFEECGVPWSEEPLIPILRSETK